MAGPRAAPPVRPPALLAAALALAAAARGAELAAGLAAAPLRVITGGDAEAVEAAQKPLENQRAFARLHGYDHRVHVGNYAHPWVPYWHKVAALLRELREIHGPTGTAPPAVVVWMDLDVVITNPRQDMLERILAAHPRAAIILTEDPMRGGPLPTVGRARRLANTGVMIVRRGREAERVLERLYDYGRAYAAAARQPQANNTLHEQDAFNWLLGGPLGQLLGPLVAVIPQRHGDVNLNTFPRGTYDESYRDPASAEWAPGDFAAHCSGLRPQLRGWCEEDACAAAEAALAAPGDLERLGAAAAARAVGAQATNATAPDLAAAGGPAEAGLYV